MAVRSAPGRTAELARRAVTQAPVAWRGLCAVAATTATVILAFAGRYGPHRDELYFLAAGRHLAWGYDDQPPLVPALARAMDLLSGGSLTVLRLPAALAVAGTVLLTGLLAREFGGGRAAQVLAAFAWATAPAVIVSGRMLSTTVFDVAGWACVAYLVARWSRTRDDRLLLALGPVVGLGLNVKTLPLLFLAALAVGILAGGPRGVGRRPATWAAAATALALWTPNLWWQATHGWPQVGKAAALSGDGLYGTRAELLPDQLLYVGPPLAVLLVVGLWWLVAGRVPGAGRALGLAYLGVVGTVLVLAGHAYYPLGALPAVLAAGAVAVAGWARGSARRRRWLGAAVTLNAVLCVAVALPVYPVDVFARSPQAALNWDAGEMIGWPELAATVAGVYRGLPADQRRTAVILTQNYGEAGALDRYGPRWGLPHPYSGHLAYWRWGPPPDGATGPIIAVGWFGPGTLEPYCSSLAVVARIDNGHHVSNVEQGAPVQLCGGPRQPWSRAWPGLRHL